MALVTAQMQALVGVGKQMMIRAINVEDVWVKQQLQPWYGIFPQSLNERVRYNLEIVGLGLSFLERVLVSDLKLNLSADIAELKDAYVDHYKDFRKTQGSHTQSAADRIVDLWADLIMLSAVNPDAPSGIPASCFLIDGNRLIIDLQIAFTASKLHAGSSRQRFEVTSAKQLLSLLSGEPYYVDYTMRPELLTSRPVLILDLSKMALKGIESSKFTN